MKTLRPVCLGRLTLGLTSLTERLVRTNVFYLGIGVTGGLKMPKYVKSYAHQLKQGDKVRTVGHDVTIHAVENYTHTTAEGKYKRARITLAGGDIWDVASTVSFDVRYVKEEKKPTWWFSQVVASNLFVFLFTSLVWCLYTYKHFNVIIPIFDGR
jgi:hypothetical protein